jgi:TRAP-type C4-dicarboxylate transport system permease small subunit
MAIAGFLNILQLFFSVMFIENKRLRRTCFMKTLEKISKKLSELLASGGVVIGILTIVFTIVNILSRIVFQSIEGATEAIGLSLIFTIGWGLAYTEFKGKNIRLDALVEKFPKKAQQIIEVINGFLYLGIFAIMTIAGYLFAMMKWQTVQETIPILNIPALPFRICLTIGFAVLCFVIFVKLVKSIREVMHK